MGLFFFFPKNLIELLQKTYGQNSNSRSCTLEYRNVFITHKSFNPYVKLFQFITMKVILVPLGYCHTVPSSRFIESNKDFWYKIFTTFYPCWLCTVVCQLRSFLQVQEYSCSLLLNQKELQSERDSKVTFFSVKAQWSKADFFSPSSDCRWITHADLEKNLQDPVY